MVMLCSQLAAADPCVPSLFVQLLLVVVVCRCLLSRA
jgi:hypothetical protein